MLIRIVYTQPAPTAFAHVGWKYYLVFVIVPLCGVPILYFFPETKGLTLEEVGAIFGDEVPAELRIEETYASEKSGAEHRA